MKEMFRRRRLPHWDVPGATYFITSCLAGSIPAEGLLDIAQYRANIEKRPKPEHVSENDWKNERWKRIFARHEEGSINGPPCGTWPIRRWRRSSPMHSIFSPPSGTICWRCRD